MTPVRLLDKAYSCILLESFTDNDEDSGNWREHLLNHPNFIKKYGGLAVHYSVRAAGARRVRKLLEQPYKECGLEVLGNGFETTVVREPEADSVRKLVRASVRLSDSRQKELAQNYERRIAITDSFYPGLAVPTGVVVEPSPLHGKPIVQLIQPYIAYRKEPPTPTEAWDFAEYSSDVVLRNGYLPDVVGMNNVVITESGMRLIDTTLLEPSVNPHVFGLSALKLYEIVNSAERQQLGVL